MTLRIYNSLTRQKEEFIPQEVGKVKMYVCGITSYDYCHLGHARAYVVWDMVRRYLSEKYEVTYVQNITDIDDKILNRARQRGVTMQEINQEFIAAYDEDMAKLNILAANAYPRATESIPAIQNLIQALVERGFAYAANGDVYYAVQQFPHYGKLSGRKLEDMQAGASGRVDETESASVKRYPLDFALWKSAKPDEPYWDSPWGKGRPGWHIECSAMVRDTFGDRIDIHAGGSDLLFPHHENEIAQSEAVTNQPLASYWMHNGFVNIDGEKMSKSLNNFTTVRSLLEHYDPMVVRLFILQAHYRQPIDFSTEAIDATKKGWETIRDGLTFDRFYADKLGKALIESEIDPVSVNRFNLAMDDDFNTSVALSVIFELAKSLYTERNNLSHTGKAKAEDQQLAQTFHTLRHLSHILGLENKTVPAFADRTPEMKFTALKGDFTLSPSDEIVEQMIEQRREARLAKNWQEGDRLRNELQNLGITLIDQPDGTTRWLRQ